MTNGRYENDEDDHDLPPTHRKTSLIQKQQCITQPKVTNKLPILDRHDRQKQAIMTTTGKCSTSGCSDKRFKPTIVYKVSLGVMAIGKVFLWSDQARIVSSWKLSALLGLPFFLAGSLFAMQAKKVFQSTSTPMMGGPKPGRKSPLHTQGVFAITRNPMYLGISIALGGAAMATNCWWHFLFPFLNAWIMDQYVIPGEEQEVETVFGKQFLEYKAQVPRWL